MSSWGTFKNPCPDCGSAVEYWYFSGDCRGNSAASGRQCKQCKREFTRDEAEALKGSTS